MLDVEVPLTRSRESSDRTRRVRTPNAITAKLFQEMFGEPLTAVLDPRQWRSGYDVAREYERIEMEVQEATRIENRVQASIRQEILPLLSKPTANPVPGAGHHRIELDEIVEIHNRLLFPGKVEAVDGTCEVHDTLPLTIYSLGVSLVSYRGDAGTWGMKPFRRDLRQQNEDPIAFVKKLLERRDERDALNHESARDALHHARIRGRVPRSLRVLPAWDGTLR